MKNFDLTTFPGVIFGSNVVISAETAEIKPGSRIGDNVFISAKNISIGYDSVIEKEVTIKGLGETMQNFVLGDNCFIGFRNQILVPSFIMLDYSQLHNSGLHSGYKSLEIGYNCWIGQNTILNSTECLSIHNNVRIGTGSQLWTHVASGELFEGCTLYGNKALTLEDDVWIVGGAVISPGLLVRKKSIIMTGSVLTKSTEERHTYAGVPAKDVTDKMNFWKDLGESEKIAMIVKFIEDFLLLHSEHVGHIQLASSHEDIEISEGLVIMSFLPEDIDGIKTKFSFFDYSNKTYLKRRSKVEIDWIKFCVGFRMRFLPI